VRVNARTRSGTREPASGGPGAGGFDIIGDVHGCGDELEALLELLGYEVDGREIDPWESPIYAHPEGRRAVFLGDLVDRGPRILDTLFLVRAMVRAGNALCLLGNHDEKLLRKLNGRQVRVAHGLEQTVAEIEAQPHDRRRIVQDAIRDFLASRPTQMTLDEGRLVVAHAGLEQHLHGVNSDRARSFALYGKVTGEMDEYGLPVRLDWAREYRGAARVVYGHTPVAEARWQNRTLNIDTGCVFGGRLTAVRYPELEVTSVPAAGAYAELRRPLGLDPAGLQRPDS
jgi:protein phosphatase